MTRKLRTLVLVLVLLLPALLAGCGLSGEGPFAAKPTPTPRPTATPRTAVADTNAEPNANADAEGDAPAAPDGAPTAVENAEEPAPAPAATKVPPAEGGANTDGSVPLRQNPQPDGGLGVEDVVKRVRPAVVQVITLANGEQAGTGSGFIIDDQSHIITNNHVVEGGDRFIVILTNNDRETAELVGRDPNTDVAVLQLRKRNLPNLPLGNSDQLQVGEQVVAIGSALGLTGEPTVTTGVVSATDRVSEEPGSPQNPERVVLYDLIQTDTAINPGNSGGPLINLRGQVIGINTLGQRATESGVPVQGVNFAVSINTARDVSSEIIRTGEVVYPYMGVEGPQFLSARLAIELNVPDNVRGQIIAGVTQGTPAARAGLRARDVITRINDTPITDESLFVTTLRRYNPGDQIRVTVLRNGREQQFTLRLADRKDIPR